MRLSLGCLWPSLSPCFRSVYLPLWPSLDPRSFSLSFASSCSLSHMRTHTYFLTSAHTRTHTPPPSNLQSRYQQTHIESGDPDLEAPRATRKKLRPRGTEEAVSLKPLKDTTRVRSFIVGLLIDESNLVYSRFRRRAKSAVLSTVSRCVLFPGLSLHNQMETRGSLAMY